MTDKMERIEALREKEPRDLNPPNVLLGFHATKLPVLIHGETVYVDDSGIWYAPTQAQAAARAKIARAFLRPICLLFTDSRLQETHPRSKSKEH